MIVGAYMLTHFLMRVEAIQGFTGGKHVTLVAVRVVGVSQIEDDDGVYAMSVHEMGPGVGSVCHPPLASPN